MTDKHEIPEDLKHLWAKAQTTRGGMWAEMHVNPKKIIEVCERIARLEAENAELARQYTEQVDKSIATADRDYWKQRAEKAEAENAELLTAQATGWGDYVVSLPVYESMQQRAETAEDWKEKALDQIVGLYNQIKSLEATLAERDKEIERLQEELRQKSKTYNEMDEEVTDLRTKLATAREALTRIASDFETDFVLDGVVVDEPYRMHQVAWEVARAALAATEEGKEAHVGTDSTAG